MKGYRLKLLKKLIILSSLFMLLSGCEPKEDSIEANKADKDTLLIKQNNKEIFTTSFKQDQQFSYKLSSSRDISLSLSGDKTKTPKLFSENFEATVMYTVIEAKEFEYSTIEVKFQNISIKRTGANKPVNEAVKYFEGKSYRIKVGPTGRIADQAELTALIRQAGDKAFRTSSRNGKIKEPDMICDVTAFQWFLFNAINSVPADSEGIAVGEKWSSILSVPCPMVMSKARAVEYTLSEIQEADQIKLAVISSEYSPSNAKTNWPMPYSGRFQVSGAFGFLSNYRISSLSGQGKEILDMKTGLTKEIQQNYNMVVAAAMPLPLPGTSPSITIKQKLVMTLID